MEMSRAGEVALSETSLSLVDLAMEVEVAIVRAVRSVPEGEARHAKRFRVRAVHTAP